MPTPETAPAAAVDTIPAAPDHYIEWTANGIPSLSDDAKAAGISLVGTIDTIGPLTLTCTAIRQDEWTDGRFTCGGKLYALTVWNRQAGCYEDRRVCAVCCTETRMR